MEHTIRLTDAEVNRYLRSKLRQLQVPETEPEKTPEPTPEKLGKKIAWGPVLKIDPKEINPAPV
jgi:hypothetical protein